MWTFKFQLVVESISILALFPINLIPSLHEMIYRNLFQQQIKMIILMDIRKYHLLQLILFFSLHPHHLLWMFKHLHIWHSHSYIAYFFVFAFLCWLPVYIWEIKEYFCDSAVSVFKYWHENDDLWSGFKGRWLGKIVESLWDLQNRYSSVKPLYTTFMRSFTYYIKLF